MIFFWLSLRFWRDHDTNFMIFSRKKKQKIKKLKPSHYWIFIYLDVQKNRKQTLKTSRRSTQPKKIIFCCCWTKCDCRSLYNSYKITENDTLKPKCHQKVQLAHYFYQRVFRVRTKQNILGLSTLHAFFISEEIEARRCVPTALTC